MCSRQPSRVSQHDQPMASAIQIPVWNRNATHLAIARIHKTSLAAFKWACCYPLLANHCGGESAEPSKSGWPVIYYGKRDRSSETHARCKQQVWAAASAKKWEKSRTLIQSWEGRKEDSGGVSGDKRGIRGVVFNDLFSVLMLQLPAVNVFM